MERLMGIKRKGKRMSKKGLKGKRQEEEKKQREMERKVKVKSLSRVQLCDPMDCSLPGSSIHGISQARTLEWVAISFSRGSFRPRE